MAFEWEARCCCIYMTAGPVAVDFVSALFDSPDMHVITLRTHNCRAVWLLFVILPPQSWSMSAFLARDASPAGHRASLPLGIQNKGSTEGWHGKRITMPGSLRQELVRVWPHLRAVRFAWLSAGVKAWPVPRRPARFCGDPKHAARGGTAMVTGFYRHPAMMCLFVVLFSLFTIVT